jgi:hypothetical protein
MAGPTRVGGLGYGTTGTGVTGSYVREGAWGCGEGALAPARPRFTPNPAPPHSPPISAASPES